MAEPETPNEYFQARFKYDPGRRAVWRAVTEDLARLCPGGWDAVVDLGTGYGDFINQVPARRRTAVDREDVREFLDPAVKFHQTEATDLSFLADESTDLVFASNLLEHLERSQAEAVVREAHRILKPGGRLILIQPNFRLCCKRYFDDYTHQTIFTDESLCGLVKANRFTVVLRRNRYLPFSMQGILPKSYWLTKLYLQLRLPVMARQLLVIAAK